MAELIEKEYYTIPFLSSGVAKAKLDSLCRWMAREKVMAVSLGDYEALMMGGRVSPGLFLDPSDRLGDTGFASLKSGRLGWRRVARAGLVVNAFRAANVEVVDGGGEDVPVEDAI